MNVRYLIGLLILLWLATLATACSPAAETPTIPAPTPIPTLDTTEPPSETEDATGTPAATGSQVSSVQDLATAIAQRTPVPTPITGPIEAFAEKIAAESGLVDQSVLGLRIEDWIDLGISLLFVLVGSLLGIGLLLGLLNRFVRRSQTKFDDEIFGVFGRELRWLVVVYLTRLALLRLDFWTDWQRTTLQDLFFVLILVIFCIIALRLIDFSAKQYQDRQRSETDRKRQRTLTLMLRWSGYVLVTMIALSVFLNHLGTNVSFTAAFLFFIGLVAVVGGRVAVADAIAGFLILVDRPYRVGDDILVKELDSWGNVLEIGMRSTRILTRDHREVIIPNSLIGQSQVVNYSYPDPSLRVQTDIGVAYGTDIDLVERVMVETVRGVEGVLPDKPVDVLFVAYGDSARQIRVRWWIDDVNDQYFALHRVNAALERALAEAGLDIPFPTYSLNVRAEGEQGSRATQAFSGASASEPGL
jgi:small-conductance mechanosensitive channel